MYGFCQKPLLVRRVLVDNGQAARVAEKPVGLGRGHTNG
jgi:hypothetical protein